jgi:hypothetical protein
MLRQLGVKPLPKSSVLEWAMLVDPGRLPVKRREHGTSDACSSDGGCAEQSVLAQAGRPGIVLKKRYRLPSDPRPFGLGYYGRTSKATCAEHPISSKK